MKIHLSSLFLLALACISFSACFVQRSVSVSKAVNNPDYTVSYLFEHDGCRVYRFYDTYSGSYVYFTTQGDATSIPNDSTRQQTVTYRHRNNDTFIKKAE
ncbi:MAG TPA: DUF4884 domain-containing protein [Mediterranea massiliensis]|uniref:DUF4884 domain-containing protein n=1 Tax=Mediterranea massiliensis TaxID=1841865 RepID=A0A921I017_9BACT|nr:DUF4884 domain-containing protein [Mediterranea massiliensis]HJF92782.1 DUF4884 domain-containing protein [Mediterranea massiliensis]